MVVPPLRKHVGVRRRQLVFADPQVQISNRAMKDQIENPLAETQDLVIHQNYTVSLHHTNYHFKYIHWFKCNIPIILIEVQISLQDSSAWFCYFLLKLFRNVSLTSHIY